jgi:hypothetical protein
MLLQEREPFKIWWRLADVQEATLDAAMPETARLAKITKAWVASHPCRPHPRRGYEPGRGHYSHGLSTRLRGPALQLAKSTHF